MLQVCNWIQNIMPYYGSCVNFFARINCTYETNKIVTSPPPKKKGVHICFSVARKKKNKIGIINIDSIVLIRLKL